jgi:hypothetical protein
MTDLINLLRTSGLSGWIALGMIYHFGTRGAWRRSKVGPWIMTICAAPLLTLLTGVASMQLGPDHTLTIVMRLALMLVLNAMPLWLAVLFVRRQREMGRDPDVEDQSSTLREGDSGGR